MLFSFVKSILPSVIMIEICNYHQSARLCLLIKHCYRYNFQNTFTASFIKCHDLNKPTIICNHIQRPWELRCEKCDFSNLPAFCKIIKEVPLDRGELFHLFREKNSLKVLRTIWSLNSIWHAKMDWLLEVVLLLTPIHFYSGVFIFCMLWVIAWGWKLQTRRQPTVLSIESFYLR